MASVAAENEHVALALNATAVRVIGLGALCVATMVAPALLFVWMPIVLGVPHVANDLRYLLLPLPRRQVVVGIIACTALVALKATSLVASVDLLRVEMVVVASWLVLALALSRGTRPNRFALGVGFVGASVIVGLPIQFALVAAFAHNVIAIGAWILVARPRRRQLAAIGMTLAVSVAVIVVAGSAVAAATGGDVTRWVAIDDAAAMMFGGLAVETGRALLIAFAFLQAVHYAIWLSWIPKSQPRRPALSRASVVVAVVTLMVIGAATVDAAWARVTYLALATFHIYLEIVVITVRLARGRSE